jgi:hypothetical protein
VPQRVRNSGTARPGAFKRRPVRPRAIMERFLLLPLEEEGWLNDMPLRENFIERVLPVGKARQGLRRKAGLSAWQFLAASCK